MSRNRLLYLQVHKRKIGQVQHFRQSLLDSLGTCLRRIGLNSLDIKILNIFKKVVFHK